MSARDVQRRLNGGGEAAFLDLREAGPFSEGHPLFAVPVPYSSLEAGIGALVPRLDVPVILIDGGDGIAEAGAEALAAMGYSDLSIVDGGTPGWADAGCTLFKGVNVPSKALGELAEELWHPKTIDAPTLESWRQAGERFSLFDCRPPSEYQKMTVPGAACLPNGEIAHRLPAIGSDDKIIVTCAGRTRGIIGVLGLSRVAPDLEIYALENGTQGWALAGLELERGNRPGDLPGLSDEDAAETLARAERFLQDEAIPLVGSADVEAFLDDATRTTFLFDVRSAEEAASDPLPAFPHVWSGQLVQATDRWVGVRRSRLVLADDLGLRAGLAAFWLRALGFDVHVARIDGGLRALPAPERPSMPSHAVTEIDAETALSEAREGRARLLDLRPSSRYEAGHVAGSAWAIRPKLSAWLGEQRFFLIGDDGPEAALGGRELQRLGHRDVALVRGGFDALREAGATIETGEPMPLSEAIDVVSFAHGRHDGDLQASQDYLDWEQGLVAALSPDERAAFHL
jgi:rhodanese-related sulfurtransferase